MCLGIPGQILDLGDAAGARATVLISGAKRRVDLSIVRDDGVAPGDWVLVHAGLALAKIDEAEARETLALQEEMSSAYLGGPAAVTPSE